MKVSILQKKPAWLKAIFKYMHGPVGLVYIFFKPFSLDFIFFMPRILQNLRKCAIGMLNADMNAVAMNTGYSTCAIRHLRQRFHASGHTEDRPCSGHLLWVRMHGQDHYILNTHLCNRFQTATATVVIITVYLPKLWAITCARVG